MIVKRVSACLALLVAGVGCSSGNDQHGLHPPVPVNGVLQMVGGPAGMGPDPAPGRVTFVSDRGKGDTTSVPTKADGTFALELSAGSYAVTGTSPSYGKGPCRADGVVAVKAGMGPVRVLCHRR